MSQLTAVVKVGDELVATISRTQSGWFVAIRDGQGTHLSIARKCDEVMHVELSSDRAMGSVWDEARRGIARELGWRRADRHANYLLNREFRVPTTEALDFSSFLRAGSFGAAKPKHAKVPTIDLDAGDDWEQVNVSLLPATVEFSGQDGAFDIGWGWLLFTVSPRTELRRSPTSHG